VCVCVCVCVCVTATPAFSHEPEPARKPEHSNPGRQVGNAVFFKAGGINEDQGYAGMDHYEDDDFDDDFDDDDEDDDDDEPSDFLNQVLGKLDDLEVTEAKRKREREEMLAKMTEEEKAELEAKEEAARKEAEARNHQWIESDMEKYGDAIREQQRRAEERERSLGLRGRGNEAVGHHEDDDDEDDDDEDDDDVDDDDDDDGEPSDFLTQVLGKLDDLEVTEAARKQERAEMLAKMTDSERAELQAKEEAHRKEAEDRNRLWLESDMEKYGDAIREQQRRAEERERELGIYDAARKAEAMTSAQ